MQWSTVGKHITNYESMCSEYTALEISQHNRSFVIQT